MSETEFPATQRRGFVQIERATPQGMISLRGDPRDPSVRRALKDVLGVAPPELREIVTSTDGTSSAAWMSPDELLLLTSRENTHDACAQLRVALEGAAVLIADMSGARVVFRLEGAALRDVLAKLCPVDFAPEAFPAGTIRRSRAGQAAVAIWFTGQAEARVICFRSFAPYVEELLAMAATPGGEVGLYRAAGA